MKKRLIGIIAIIALLLAINPISVMARVGVTVDLITDKNPGSSVTISGTTGLSEVTIKVSRPDTTVLYVDVAAITSGAYSNTFSLPANTALGTYTVIVGQSSAIATTTFEVVARPSSGGGGGTTPPPAQDLAPTTDAVNTTTTTVITPTVKVTTAANGDTVETFTVPATVQTQIDQAVAQGKSMIQITVATTANADQTVVDIPANIMQSSAGLGIAVRTPDVTIELPQALVDSFAAAGQELTITVEKGTVAEATAQMSGVPGTEGAKVLGTPAKINTTLKGSNIVTLPLTGISIPTDAAAQASFLKSLAILAVHSGSDKQVIQGTIVKDADGKPIGISFNVDRFSTFAIIQLATPQVTLNDIAGTWAEENIKGLVATGAINGYPDGTFKPDNNITRAEFATVVVKAFKLETRTGKVFSDTVNNWAKDYIATANAYGIVNGYSDSMFGPDDQVTREQMAVMIVKAANLTTTAGSKTFTDGSAISAWAADAVAAASSNGIISGYPDGSFAPQGNATRAEAVTVIIRALK